jgi:hypothetical protein
MEYFELAEMYLESLPALVNSIDLTVPLEETIKGHFLDTVQRCEAKAVELAKEYRNDQSRGGESTMLRRLALSSARHLSPNSSIAQLSSGRL